MKRSNEEEVGGKRAMVKEREMGAVGRSERPKKENLSGQRTLGGNWSEKRKRRGPVEMEVKAVLQRARRIRMMVSDRMS